MNTMKIFKSIGNINENYIDEAAPEATIKRFPKIKRVSRFGVAVAAVLVLLVGSSITAIAIEIHQYNAAVAYLTSLGIDAEDLSDYSRGEIKEAAKTIDAGEKNEVVDKLMESVNKKASTVVDTPTKITSEQVRNLTPTMTYTEVIKELGDTIDTGSGIYILEYEVDGKYPLTIPFAGDDAQLGVTGEKLLEALQPIE